jgi:hypothetical protein
MAFQQRLVHDVAETKNKPYPNIAYYPSDRGKSQISS